MIRLLQWLFTGHVHKWKTIDKAKLWGECKERPIGAMYIQQCEYCGLVKRRDL